MFYRKQKKIVSGQGMFYLQGIREKIKGTPADGHFPMRTYQGSRGQGRGAKARARSDPYGNVSIM